MVTTKNNNDDAKGSKNSVTKKKSGNKKSGTTKITPSNNNDEANESIPLVRSSTSNEPHSINPRGILTGFYGKNGKRMQHTVHCGALQMPKDAVDVIENFIKSTGMQPITKYDLPGLDSVVRPCIDTEIQSIIVTQLMIEKVNVPQVEEPKALAETGGIVGIVPEAPKIVPNMVKTSRSVAKNRLIRRVPTKKALLKLKKLGAERIRGGGDWDFGATEGQQQQCQQTDQVGNMDIDETPESLTGIETTQTPTTVDQMSLTSNITESTNFYASSTSQDPSSATKAPTIDNSDTIPKKSNDEEAATAPQPSEVHNDQMPFSSGNITGDTIQNSVVVPMQTTTAIPTSTESSQLSMNTLEKQPAITEILAVPTTASAAIAENKVKSTNDMNNDNITSGTAQEQTNPQYSTITAKTGESNTAAENETFIVATSVTSTPTPTLTPTIIIPADTTTDIVTNALSYGKDISSLQASNAITKTDEFMKAAEKNDTVVAGESTISATNTVAVTTTAIRKNTPSGGKDIDSLRASSIIAKADDELNKVAENDTSTATAAVSLPSSLTASLAAGSTTTRNAPSGGKDIYTLRASNNIVKTDESIQITENDTATTTASTTNTSTPSMNTERNAPSGGKDFASLQAMKTVESNKIIVNDKYVAVTASSSSSQSNSTIAGAATSNNIIDDPSVGKSVASLTDKIASSTSSSNAPVATGLSKSASAAPVKKEEKTTEVPQVKALTSRPAPQWEQHKPGPNDETITTADQLPPKPEWYKKDGIDEIERTMLPEWFDISAPHRTPETFLKSREKITEMSETLANRNVTNVMIRRTILGDAGSLHRLRGFLERWGIINNDGINDSAPTPAGLRPDLKRPAKFNDEIRVDLIAVVTQQAKKRRLNKDYNDDMNLVSSSVSSFDWEEVASLVGHGASAEDCQRNFMTTSLDEKSSSTLTQTSPLSELPTSSNVKQEVITSVKTEPNQQSERTSQKEFIRNLVQSSDSEVLKKVLDVAMEATCDDIAETQAASLLGLLTTKAVEDSRGHEIDLAVRLSKLVDSRMQKLENRMAMMDDVEAILEAEKLALEMERRDLYTARCRHWFGGV